ncbi:IclR family transcriptional regulator [Enterococcus thailandicus]|uniref:IclR family transcriptional regulator n=1 Tax=Enterococcus thailandicus TaxID=417368 RepID=UPI0022EC1690|nr:IclR family transcriptional regulator [Enterococcus thailandicus]MDA3974125.1 IclR family transcriptional regulator [Enterococcus thailandicus]MDA3976713.1 IclR family transcriptional regulator [Enterococcus thailandicus]MDA3981579.1 IclR family transcriptional regulator [Enterococcus thailandicus]
MENKKPYGTVLIKASTILDYLAEAPDSSLQAIAKGTGMTASTALKILDTLTLIGYTNKNSDKNYRLGSKFIRYANKSIEEQDLVEVTRPYLEQLQDTIDETIHLGILNNEEILYVNKLEAKNQTIRMSSKIGVTRPLYSSAMGKAVLAEFDENQYDTYLTKHPLIPFTEYTITNPLRLKSEIEKVQQSKIAYDDEEMEQDIFCIGAAIVKNNEIIGAFSISMPKYRLTGEIKNQIVAAVKQTKQKIEETLIKK